MTQNRIDLAFEGLRAAGRLGLFPYLTAGYPALEATEGLSVAAIGAGADGIELGVPFSDPLADGATLQQASEVALRNGASLAWVLDLTARIRRQIEAPIVLMTYFNPVHHYGVERFVLDAAGAGADGVIVPDLPSSEAGGLEEAGAASDFYVIPMVAPTTTVERLNEVGRSARGFVYCVSLLGITGARQTLSDRLPTFMARVRAHIRQPLLVGFGISRPEHVAALRAHADAVVVASAIADLLGSTASTERETALGSYVRELRSACEAPVRT